MKPIKTVCSYCKKKISGPDDAKFISHGICDDCYTGVMEKIERDYKKYLEENHAVSAKE